MLKIFVNDLGVLYGAIALAMAICTGSKSHLLYNNLDSSLRYNFDLKSMQLLALLRLFSMWAMKISFMNLLHCVDWLLTAEMLQREKGSKSWTF